MSSSGKVSVWVATPASASLTRDPPRGTERAPLDIGDGISLMGGQAHASRDPIPATTTWWARARGRPDR